MWAVCYSVMNTPLTMGEVIEESGGNTTIRDSIGRESGWDSKFVDTFPTEAEAITAFNKQRRGP